MTMREDLSGEQHIAFFDPDPLLAIILVFLLSKNLKVSFEKLKRNGDEKKKKSVFFSYSPKGIHTFKISMSCLCYPSHFAHSGNATMRRAFVAGLHLNWLRRLYTKHPLAFSAANSCFSVEYLSQGAVSLRKIQFLHCVCCRTSFVSWS